MPSKRTSASTDQYATLLVLLGIALLTATFTGASSSSSGHAVADDRLHSFSSFAARTNSSFSQAGIVPLTINEEVVAPRPRSPVTGGDKSTGPSGQYCGSLTGGIFKGALEAEPVAHRLYFHIEGSISHLNRTCEEERYTYDPKTGAVDLPDVHQPGNCIGGLLDEGGHLSLAVVYHDKEDLLRLDLGFVHVDCKPCEF